jgi:hypothetical protein
MPIQVPVNIRLTAETTIYQNEVKCRVLENDFNYSQNPTVFTRPSYGRQATATISIYGNIVASGTITVSVFNPAIQAIVTLGTFTVTAATTNATAVAAGLALSITQGTHGFAATATNNVVTVIAAPNLGSLINGGNNLIVTITGNTGRIFDNTFNQTFN